MDAHCWLEHRAGQPHPVQALPRQKPKVRHKIQVEGLEAATSGRTASASARSYEQNHLALANCPSASLVGGDARSGPSGLGAVCAKPQEGRTSAVTVQARHAAGSPTGTQPRTVRARITHCSWKNT